MQRGFRIILVLTLLCVSAGLAGCSKAGTSVDKIKITKLDDLPQHTYPASGKVAELVKSPEGVAVLAEQVRANVEADLAKYEISDATTLKRMYGALLTIDLLEGKDAAALERIELIRELQDKESQKLTTGLISGAMIAARREVGADAEHSVFAEAFGRHLDARVAKLPWDVIEDEIQSSKGRMEIMSENLLDGIIQARMEPAVAKTGELNADQAASVLGMHLTLTKNLPLKDVTIAVYQKLIDAHKTVKPDIWADRALTLKPEDELSPVLMGVWDSGADPAIFKDILWVNPDEKQDGADTDGNGFVDDLYGPAYDYNANRAVGALKPLGDAAERMPRLMDYVKGLMDLQAAVDSPEGLALKKHLSGLNPADFKGFLEDLSLAGGYTHGTHVAGIMVDGNPFARLLVARHSYDHHTVPVVRTFDWGGRDAAKCLDTVEYLKRADVRVVNMSWGESQRDAEASYEANGVGETAEERRELARKVFLLQKQGLYDAIKNAPDILFVCAAGNADNDVEFDEYIASSFELPNLITVGAVDQAGEPTSFTSFGKTVQVYANGFEVESYVPGGQRMKMSGTSMASPNVANLAGKLLAMNPSLTPPEVIELIKAGADKRTAGNQTFLLMNPQRSAELVKGR